MEVEQPGFAPEQVPAQKPYEDPTAKTLGINPENYRINYAKKRAELRQTQRKVFSTNVNELAQTFGFQGAPLKALRKKMTVGEPVGSVFQKVQKELQPTFHLQLTDPVNWNQDIRKVICGFNPLPTNAWEDMNSAAGEFDTSFIIFDWLGYSGASTNYPCKTLVTSNIAALNQTLVETLNDPSKHFQKQYSGEPFGVFDPSALGEKGLCMAINPVSQLNNNPGGGLMSDIFSVDPPAVLLSELPSADFAFMAYCAVLNEETIARGIFSFSAPAAWNDPQPTEWVAIHCAHPVGMYLRHNFAQENIRVIPLANAKTDSGSGTNMPTVTPVPNPSYETKQKDRNPNSVLCMHVSEFDRLCPVVLAAARQHLIKLDPTGIGFGLLRQGQSWIDPEQSKPAFELTEDDFKKDFAVSVKFLLKYWLAPKNLPGEWFVTHLNGPAEMQHLFDMNTAAELDVKQHDIAHRFAMKGDRPVVFKFGEDGQLEELEDSTMDVDVTGTGPNSEAPASFDKVSFV